MSDRREPLLDAVIGLENGQDRGHIIHDMHTYHWSTTLLTVTALECRALAL